MLTKNDFCDYDTCVALKELGFPQDYIFARYAKVDKLVDCTYHKKGDLIISEDRFAFTLESESIATPLLYEAQKFLREEKGILLQPTYLELSDEWICVIRDKNKRYGYSAQKQKNYEEALSEGLREAVKILKEK